MKIPEYVGSVAEQYPAITQPALCASWAGYAQSGIAQPTEVCLGAYEQPDFEVRAIVSVDACEVLRLTSSGVYRALGLEAGKKSDYAVKALSDYFSGDEQRASQVIKDVVTYEMNNGGIAVDPDIDAIVEELTVWRNNGVYSVLNTSTLPGCERATITMLEQYTPKSTFGAILFPRNHHGRDRVTKGVAFSALAEQIGVDIGSVVCVKIDDLPHHLEGFLAEVMQTHTGERVALYAPVYADNVRPHDKIRYTTTPLEAFKKAGEFLIQTEVIK